MKKNDIDLSILGTDKETAGRLADGFAVPEEGKEKIFRQSLKKYRHGAVDAAAGDAVQGVERYRRPVWSRIAAAAAVVALAAGGTGTGLLMLKGRSLPPAMSELPGGEEVTEGQEETEVPATEAPTEEPTEMPTEYLRELEILSDTMRTMTDEEHIQIIYAGTEDYRQNGPARLDREKYIAKFRAAADTESLNTPELKSYIYDIMLNSLHYFDTISGHHTFISTGNNIETDFGFDQVNHYSWEEEKDEDRGFSWAVYDYDGTHYDVNNQSMTYETFVSSEESIGFNVGTNDWMMLNTEGENISCIQPDSSLLGLVNSTGFAPQIPQSHLHDLSAWQILSVTEVNGMECAEIEGDWWKGHYKLYVDLHHGFLMKYDNSDGDHYELTDLHIDEPVEKRTFDPEGYSGTDIYGNPT